ncbi:MAG: hypothetical protein AB4911_05535 [Oscillochloridaceae bacterium umkhey_bin13]
MQQQLRMVAGHATPVAFCHLDVLMLGATHPAEVERCSVRSLRQAHWLIEYVEQQRVRPWVEPIGVIQGQSVEHVFYVAQMLAAMGYTRFALGSMAVKVASARDYVLRRVEAALEAVGTRLHILGVSSVAVLQSLARLGVESVDSGTPIKEAAAGGLLYSEPFRRFKLPSAHFREWSRSYGFAEIIEAPLPCTCPVCRDDPMQIMEPRGKRFVNLRAIHNYYHLRRAIEGSVSSIVDLFLAYEPPGKIALFTKINPDLAKRAVRPHKELTGLLAALRCKHPPYQVGIPCDRIMKFHEIYELLRCGMSSIRLRKARFTASESGK